MAAPTPAPAPQEKPSAQVIGQAFADQYYTVLHQSPELVYRFYQDISKLGRPHDGGNMGLTTGMDEINDKIQSYGNLKAEIKSVDAQESYNGGVIVLITGDMVREDDIRQSFTQTFFLAPQEVGYFVLNDVFRYVEDGHLETENADLANGLVVPNTEHQEVTPVQHNEIVDHPEEVNGGEVYDPSEDEEGSVVEQVEPEPLAVAEVVNEVPVEAEVVLESESKSEKAPKMTYASIVKVIKNNSTQMRAPVKSIPKAQPPQQVSAAPPPAPVAENIVANSNVAEDASNQEGEGEGFSIYVKNLPLNSGPVMVEEAFKNFGAIKRNGIQVRSNKGFCFGFVEFETPEAAQNAIEAGSIEVGGRQVFIEEKKSTNSGGSNRGRFVQARGGFRNEGARGGRGGGYGRGRGYGRGEFVRSDYGNRGSGGRGYQNRNYEGYQKGEMGNGGNRVNRGGGTTTNIVDKAQRVPATA